MSANINELEQKIRELEAFNSRIIGAMSAMDGINRFQKDVLAVEEISKIYEVAADRLKKITSFNFLAFFSINESMTFDLSHIEPCSFREVVDSEFNKQMEAGMLAWALNSDKSINTKALTETLCSGPELLIYPLESNTGISGLFVGQPASDIDEMHQLDLTLLNVSLSSTSLALDNTKLTQQLKQSNLELESKVEARTQNLKVALEKANEATKAKSAFLATMSHEIRTPMNGVLGMCELILETKLSDEQYKYASVINNSGKALLTIINDILDFSKIEAGKLELDYVPFNLRCTVEDVVNVLSQRAAEKGLELVSDIEPGTPFGLIGDNLRLRQILLNLGSNAIKFTEKGHVCFTVSSSINMDGTCTVDFLVEDTGIGIPEDKLDRLFQSFSQVDSSTSRKYGGTGLGLTISQSLCEMMEGRISVKSKVGEGSKFSFEIDLEISDSNPSAEIEDKLKGKNALLICGSDVQSKVLESYLSWNGIEVECRNTLNPITLSSIPTQSFDFLLLDYALISSSSDVSDEILRLSQKISQKTFLIKPHLKNDDLIKIESKFSSSVLKPVNYEALINTLLKREQKRTVDIESFVLPYTKTWNALLVDDDQTNLQVAKLRLEKMNLKVTMADSGIKALELFDKFNFDIVFMDCHMPEMDGYTTTKMIRQIELEKDSSSSVPIMALSANVAEDAAKTCFAAGMDGYLTKPIIIADLIRALEKWLLNRHELNLQDSTIINRSDLIPQEQSVQSEISDSEELSVDENFIDVTVIRDLLGMENYDLEKSLISTFLTDSLRRNDELKEAMDTGDCKKVNYLSHTIKGGASNIGAKAIQFNCKVIEDLSGENDLSKIEPLIDKLGIELKRLQAFYDENYAD